MKMNKLVIIIALLLLPALGQAWPKGRHHSGYDSYSYHSTCYVCSHRSMGERAAFIRSNPKPFYGRGIVDHIVSLKHGGGDSRYNMQWQTYSAAKAKDKWE